MSHESNSLATSLMVRDAAGRRYRPATDAQIIEAARQVVDRKMQRGEAFTSAADVETFLQTKLAGLEHEVFAVLFLDQRHRLIEYAELFRGTVHEAHVYLREVVKLALRLNAAAVIVAHNHPSGDPTPGGADQSVTCRLKEALALVDVRLLDHIIIGGRSSVSMARRGLI
ncbi:DNA repair protein RadC [Dokdonella koreensis DS-123]|uniref:DNA repair protein RadC n=2 Tax=Dokdonella TaxID=323413 RepID=A0A167H3X8_9GAMM|nr:DNA repair protein RadC [Dokdonella koreensis]ANB18792.1 DNA repair protein RadC [Dokdonella koreensis DS-123]